jgi:hypothetical protein
MGDVEWTVASLCHFDNAKKDNSIIRRLKVNLLHRLPIFMIRSLRENQNMLYSFLEPL